MVVAGASADLSNPALEPVSSDGEIKLIIGKVQLRIDVNVDAAAVALVLDRLLLWSVCLSVPVSGSPLASPTCAAALMACR